MSTSNRPDDGVALPTHAQAAAPRVPRGPDGLAIGLPGHASGCGSGADSEP